MKLNRLYIHGVMFPSLIAITSTSILAMFDNGDHKGELLKNNSFIFMAFLASVFHSFVISILALTIFLNNKIIKTIGVPTFLSWFLLPMTWIILTVYKTIIHRLYYETGTTDQLVYLITLNLPFVIGLVWSYIIFKKINYRELPL